jgi:hypothetical protein
VGGGVTGLALDPRYLHLPAHDRTPLLLPCGLQPPTVTTSRGCWEVPTWGGAVTVVVHRGGCHCGRVRFEVEAPAMIVAKLCNCSICSMTAYLHLIVPRSHFRLIAGDNELETYTFNTGVAQHRFCRVCGIKSFYVPRSNPDGISVNVRCLVPDTIESVKIDHFDGRDWEFHAHELAHLSSELEDE